MENELKQDFTRRLSQCNKGQMIVIIYDIFFAYAQDIRDSYEKKEDELFRESVRKAQKTVAELQSALDFSYPIATELRDLYVCVKKLLAETMYKRDLEALDNAERIMKPLYEGFVEAAKQDTSEPLMKNTQKVYAGMTYGRQNLTENLVQMSDNRGFLI